MNGKNQVRIFVGAISIMLIFGFFVVNGNFSSNEPTIKATPIDLSEHGGIIFEENDGYLIVCAKIETESFDFENYKSLKQGESSCYAGYFKEINAIEFLFNDGNNTINKVCKVKTTPISDEEYKEMNVGECRAYDFIEEWLVYLKTSDVVVV